MVLLALACDLPEPEYGQTVEAECAERTAFYRDADGDGHGDPQYVWVTCEAPEGYVEAADDCDDTDAEVSSGCTDSGA